jgi:hypothetical protein
MLQKYSPEWFTAYTLRLCYQTTRPTKIEKDLQRKDGAIIYIRGGTRVYFYNVDPAAQKNVTKNLAFFCFEEKT